MEIKIKNPIPFTIAQEMKSLGITLPKYGRNWQVETYRMLMKEIKEYLK